MIESRPYVFEPGPAASRAATSCWTRKTTRGVRAANSRRRRGVATEYGRFPTTASARGSGTERASPVTTRMRGPNVEVRNRARRRSRSMTVSGPRPRRRRAAVRAPRPPPTSTTGCPGDSSTSAASASATNGSVRNDWPHSFDGRTPREASVERISSGRSGTAGTVPSSAALRRDEEAVLVLDTAQFLLDAADDQPLGVLHVDPRLEVLEARERAAPAFVHDLLHRLLPDPGKELEKVEPARNGGRLVEEPKVPLVVPTDDRLERAGELRASGDGQLVVADAAPDVVDRRRRRSFGHERDAGPRGEGRRRAGYELEELQFVLADGERDRLAVEPALRLPAVRQVIEDDCVILHTGSPPFIGALPRSRGVG